MASATNYVYDTCQPGPAAELRIGVIGYGYWGPNVVRNLHGLDNCQLVAICDSNPANLQGARQASS